VLLVDRVLLQHLFHPLRPVIVFSMAAPLSAFAATWT